MFGSAWAQTPAPELPVLAFTQPVERLSPVYLREHIWMWLALRTETDAPTLAAHLDDLYLQWGYPEAEVAVQKHANGWEIAILEQGPAVPVTEIRVSGGTPQQRYIARHNLTQALGQPLNRDALNADLNWLEHNHFLPLQLRLEQPQPDQLVLDLQIVSGAEWFPTGNLALNDVVGLAITAGVIVDNPLNSGQIVRAMGKRNNIPFLCVEPLFCTKSQNQVQDWEYLLSWSTTQLPLEGWTIGVNHYNKVDYLFPYFRGDAEQLVSIRSLGADLYSGFPIWADSRQRRYLRGTFNLSLIDDEFHVAHPERLQPTSLSQSGKNSDLLLMPSLTLSYSDIDDYRIPRNGSFVQGRLGGSLLDARFLQATLTGLSVWTPWSDAEQQWTWLFRSAAGSTFGANPPFYRGFLNTGNWLVRGATQFSITEKHSLRFSEELHYIYRPNSLQLEQLSQKLTGSPNRLGLFEGWALDGNVFLDQGAYWRDSVLWQSAQLSIGFGVNTITPGGTILGVDVATPLYPVPGDGISALLRISAPLSFTLYSDWINSNGFFLR
ncbi:MAG: BamA/TamA family outer membrane protein [Candidatus Sericytochromatia bacterium]